MNYAEIEKSALSLSPAYKAELSKALIKNLMLESGKKTPLNESADYVLPPDIDETAISFSDLATDIGLPTPPTNRIRFAQTIPGRIRDIAKEMRQTLKLEGSELDYLYVVWGAFSETILRLLHSPTLDFDFEEPTEGMMAFTGTIPYMVVYISHRKITTVVDFGFEGDWVLGE